VGTRERARSCGQAAARDGQGRCRLEGLCQRTDAENGYEAVVKLLLATCNADVDLKDRNGQRPLSLAAQNGHEAVVELLLKANVDVESKDRNSWTPLSWAARNGYEAIVKLLLEAKADVESKDI